MTKLLTEEESLDASLPNLGDKFVVYHPYITSYLIKSFILTKSTLTLNCWLLKRMPNSIMEWFESPVNIIIHMLHDNGQPEQEFIIGGATMKDYCISGDWNNHDPMEITVVYDISDVINRFHES